MKIRALAVKIPSRQISNQTILGDIRRANPDLPADVVERYIGQVERLLRLLGARSRCVRDRSEGETAFALTTTAMRDAIDQAGLQPSEIDLLIYCGVAKGFLEPASAYFFARALGLRCECFDIADACLGWLRAVDVAQMAMQAGRYRHVLIVNAEFTAHEYGYPDAFRIRDAGQLEYTFPVFTIGEAATATIVEPSPTPWSFHYGSRPDMADLCTIPLRGYEDFQGETVRTGLNGPGGFVSFGGALVEAAIDEMVALVRRRVPDLQEPDLWITHAASRAAGVALANRLEIDLAQWYLEVFPNYGNLISASIPVGLKMAADNGRLKHGDKVVLCPAAAGMAVGVAQFVYAV